MLVIIVYQKKIMNFGLLHFITTKMRLFIDEMPTSMKLMDFLEILMDIVKFGGNLTPHKNLLIG
jgi:hypothetical protein